MNDTDTETEGATVTPYYTDEANGVTLRCGVKGCQLLPRYVVSVYERDGEKLWHEMDTYACEEHAARRGVLKIGELVPSASGSGSRCSPPRN